MPSVNITPFTLAVFLFCMIFSLGLCCSCIQTAKKTARYLSTRKAALKTQLEKVESGEIKGAEADRIIAESEEFENLTSNKSLLHYIPMYGAEALGDDLNDTQIGYLWDLFVNETFFGRFFTQEVVAEPINDIISILNTLIAFLGRDLLTAWFATHANPTQALSETVTVIFIFNVVFRSSKKMLDSYARQYQGDLVQGKNLVAAPKDKDV